MRFTFSDWLMHVCGTNYMLEYCTHFITFQFKFKDKFEILLVDCLLSHKKIIV